MQHICPHSSGTFSSVDKATCTLFPSCLAFLIKGLFSITQQDQKQSVQNQITRGCSQRVFVLSLNRSQLQVAPLRTESQSHHIYRPLQGPFHVLDDKRQRQAHCGIQNQTTRQHLSLDQLNFLRYRVGKLFNLIEKIMYSPGPFS